MDKEIIKQELKNINSNFDSFLTAVEASILDEDWIFVREISKSLLRINKNLEKNGGE